MNKIKFITKKVMFTGISIAFFLIPLIGTANNESAYNEVNEHDLKARIENLASEVDLRYTDEVHAIIDTYIKRYRKGSERLLGLSEQFFPLYEAEFSKQGIPDELKYLSIVESGLKPTAISSSGAVGLWQFMKGTGQLYGLRINSSVDERKDPIKSTQAASQYLKDLHDQFGDWTLALAAYNCGPGNVRKAIRRSQANEYWDMKGYLPRETRRYIPKYVAVSYVMNYSDVHELYPIYENEQNALATVVIYDYTSFKDISHFTGLSMSKIAEYNPSYKKWFIPKSSNGYYLTLPQEDLFQYLAQKGGFENLLEVGNHNSEIRDTYFLWGAIKKKAISTSKLPSLNNLHRVQLEDKDSRKIPIRIGMVITPVAPIENSKFKTYQIKPQESLLDVARSHNIKLSRLISMNQIDPSQPVPPGTIIRLE